MHVQITVRYGTAPVRYHQTRLTASSLREVLLRAAAELPDEVLHTGDLLEIRPDVDPDARRYLGEDSD